MLTPVDEVLSFIQEKAIQVDEEIIELSAGLGRVLSKDIRSSIDVPSFDNSAMDGYAINAEGVNVGSKLPISDRIPAGSVGQDLTLGTAARIFTGAPLPIGTNAVVMQENTSQMHNEVLINEDPQVGQNVRRAGQDIKSGVTVLKAGRRLKAQDLGLIASLGCAEMSVFRRLRVAVISTGNELVSPTKKLQPGQIYNSNQYTLVALVEQLGMVALDMGCIGDSFSETEKALTVAEKEADCIISSGGVSVGEEDYVKAVVEKLGSLDLWKLAIKPGKPLAFGMIGTTPFFGLPGNPVSSFVTFNIVARPYLMLCQGCHDGHLMKVEAQTDFDFKAGNRKEYLRVKLKFNDQGRCIASLFANQGSGIMSSVSWADGLAEVEINGDICQGDRIKINLTT
ncbi:MAG: molybdopterin molybdotransferase [Candidatus Azotimanducaceae bacterium]|jgi:molybdopterin molybdotransferase